MSTRRLADGSRPRRRLGSSGVGSGSLGAIVLATLAFCLLPGSAAARHVIAPPGNAGVEQYVEVVPGAEGNEPVDGHSGKGDAISQSTQQQLEALGPEGKADASFAQTTGSARGRAGSEKGGKHAGGNGYGPGSSKAKGGGGGSSAGTPGGGQPAQTAAGGGIGIGLPLALALIALLALGGGLLRRRSLS